MTRPANWRKKDEDRCCFVLMPFAHKLDAVYRAISGAVRDARAGLCCRRGDELTSAGFLVGQIKEQIKVAALVIADLTGRNPNVFYETAIAHCCKDERQVILLARDLTDVPFDLHHLRCLSYKRTPRGLKKLRKDLVPWIRDGLKSPAVRPIEIVEGRKWRTERIVTDCEVFLQGGPPGGQPGTIRFTGGLSPLSITDRDAKRDDAELGRLLVREGQGIRHLILHGWTFRAILAPRPLLFGGVGGGDRQEARYRRLAELLNPDCKEEELMSRVQIALIEPSHIGSVLVFAEQVLYEGIKGSIRGGFDLTIRIADAEQIAARVRKFEELFKEATRYTLRRYGRSTGTPADLALRQASFKGVQECYQQFVDGCYHEHC